MALVILFTTRPSPLQQIPSQSPPLYVFPRSSFAQKETNGVNVPIRLLHIVKRFHYKRISTTILERAINTIKTQDYSFSLPNFLPKNLAASFPLFEQLQLHTPIIRLTPFDGRSLSRKVCAFPFKSSSSDKLFSFDYTQTDRT